MLRNNLAGLIEPMFDSARAHASVVAQKRNQVMLQVDRVIKCRSEAILAQNFWVENGRPAEKHEMAGLRLSAEARGSRAVCTERYKKSSDDRPRCLENPRPEGAESYLNWERCSLFPAEPRHTKICSSTKEAWREFRQQ
jgi:hypothetical protein